MEKNETYYDFVRDNPIEKVIQTIYDNAIGIISPEPCIENREILYAVKSYADLALKKILQEDAKYRPREEWTAAIEVVECIRDDALELIADLDKIFG